MWRKNVIMIVYIDCLPVLRGIYSWWIVSTFQGTNSSGEVKSRGGRSVNVLNETVIAMEIQKRKSTHSYLHDQGRLHGKGGVLVLWGLL